MIGITNMLVCIHSHFMAILQMNLYYPAPQLETGEFSWSKVLLPRVPLLMATNTFT